MELEKHMDNEFSMGEQKLMKDVEVVRLADGLGYGEGSISYLDRANEAGSEFLQKAEAIITSADVLVPVDTDKSGQQIDDDGCGDGRRSGRIFHGTVEKFKSLHRPKVFGGGVAMATASLIGQGKAFGSTLQESFSSGISTLKDKLIDFGGHTDTHAHGDNCGCGAIDKAPNVVANVVKYREQITSSLGALNVDVGPLDAVLGNFAKYASEIQDQPYSGKNVMGEIVNNGKIVKELADDHLEMYVILNEVEGFTVDQEKIREVTEGKAQAFVVDVWRLRQIAARIHDGKDAEAENQSFISELVYTLGVAATLTKGDLPVYVISKQPELVAA